MINLHDGHFIVWTEKKVWTCTKDGDGRKRCEKLYGESENSEDGGRFAV